MKNKNGMLERTKIIGTINAFCSPIPGISATKPVINGPRPPDNEMIISGPFNVSDHLEGEFVELSRNKDYFYSK